MENPNQVDFVSGEWLLSGSYMLLLASSVPTEKKEQGSFLWHFIRGTNPGVCPNNIITTQKVSSPNAIPLVILTTAKPVENKNEKRRN